MKEVLHMSTHGSEGNVFGLEAYMARYCLDKFFESCWLDNGSTGMSTTFLVIPWSATTHFYSRQPEQPAYLYHLLERKGGMALWQIDAVEMYSYDPAPFDSTTCDPYTFAEVSVFPANINVLPGYGPDPGCVVFVRFAFTPSNGWCFVTASWEPPTARLRSTVQELVLAIGDAGDSAANADKWAACLGICNPESDAWNADAVTTPPAGDTWPAGEHFPRQGVLPV